MSSIEFFISRINAEWKDERHKARNEGRRSTCPSNNVDPIIDGQFWLPYLDVLDAIELGRYFFHVTLIVMRNIS